ncbi:hypothetical protein B0J14DRAFT_589716 [Halenospora varia]|nr:hypothetical protein B0J14DRAFT_589716 [Halenospora varia]
MINFKSLLCTLLPTSTEFRALLGAADPGAVPPLWCDFCIYLLNYFQVLRVVEIRTHTLHMDRSGIREKRAQTQTAFVPRRQILKGAIFYLPCAS